MIATLGRSENSPYFGVADLRSYDVWGSVRSGSTTGDPKQRYCANLGHVQDDESGLIYMRARYYEPWSGRFISEDPEMQGWNWYPYSGSDPVNFVDADGNQSSPDWETWFKSLTTSIATVGVLMIAYALYGVSASYSGGALIRCIGCAVIGLTLIALAAGVNTPDKWTGLGVGLTALTMEALLGTAAQVIGERTVDSIALEFTSASIGSKTIAAAAVMSALAYSMLLWTYLVTL